MNRRNFGTRQEEPGLLAKNEPLWCGGRAIWRAPTLGNPINHFYENAVYQARGETPRLQPRLPLTLDSHSHRVNGAQRQTKGSWTLMASAHCSGADEHRKVQPTITSRPLLSEEILKLPHEHRGPQRPFLLVQRCGP